MPSPDQYKHRFPLLKFHPDSSGGDDAVDDAEDAGAVGRRDRVHALVEHGGVGVAQERDGAGVVDPAVDRPADELVHDGQGVAHGPAAGAHHEREDAGADGDVLGAAQAGEVGLEHVGRDEAEGVVGLDGAKK